METFEVCFKIKTLVGFTLLIISRETKLIKVQKLRMIFEGIALLNMYEIDKQFIDAKRF